MRPSYVPILKAKKGELTALSNTRTRAMRRILPLFEIPPVSTKTEGKIKTIQKHLDDVADQIAKVIGNAEVLVDMFYWATNSKTQHGEHVLTSIFSRLESLGTKMCPVVGYDRWDDIEYRDALANLSIPSDRTVCIRLEAEAIEDFNDPDYFNSQLTEIIDSLSIVPEYCAVIIDFGDVTTISIQEIQEKASRGISHLQKWQFKFIAIAGCSLPFDITDVVPEQNSTNEVLRREMLSWQATRAEYPSIPLIFSDFGVRSPRSDDNIINPHMNGKIRYTTRNRYFVARGHSMQQGNKGEQYYDLAKIIAKSKYFLGPAFSWGDKELLARSQHESNGPGNATTWIGIDTNHHIEAVLAEIFEFEQQIITSESTAKA